MPAAFGLERLEQPGLPERLLTGNRFERAGADLRATGWPLRLLVEKYRFTAPSGAEEELSLWGLELEIEAAARPFLRLPAVSLRAGIVEILEGPLEDEIELYLSLAWRP